MNCSQCLCCFLSHVRKNSDTAKTFLWYVSWDNLRNLSKSSSLHPCNMEHLKMCIMNIEKASLQEKSSQEYQTLDFAVRFLVLCFVVLVRLADKLRQFSICLLHYLSGFVSAFFNYFEILGFFLTLAEKKLMSSHWQPQVVIHAASVLTIPWLKADKFKAEKERTAARTSANVGGCTVTGNHLSNSVNDLIF